MRSSSNQGGVVSANLKTRITENINCVIDTTPKLIKQYRSAMKHINITKQQLHTFIDKEIDKYKSKKGRAFFYKKPKRLEIVGEKRVMRFDTKDRKFQIDGATGKRLYKKGGKRTTTPEHNMLVNDLDIQEGYKFRNVPMNQRLRYLLIGKKCLKFSYLADSDSFKVEFPKATRTLIKNLYAKNFEDFEQKGDINE